MKKDRDCNMPYPVYPPYQGMNMVPNMGVPYGMPIMNYQPSYNTPNSIDQQINNIEQKINNIERRIEQLENMYSTNKYNSSNYQMM